MSIHKKSLRSSLNVEQNAEQKKCRNTIKFTHLTIKHLKIQSKRKIFWCDGMTGFGIEVSSKGSKTWVYQFRIDCKARRMVLGKFPRVSLSEAIALYSNALSKVEMGIDPLDEKQAKNQKLVETPSLDDLISLYITHCKNSGKITYKPEERFFKVELPAFIRRKKITEVTYKELAKVFHSIIARGSPSTASHLFSYTRRLFNFGADMGLIKYNENPCLEIKLKLPKKKRQRHLKPNEIYQLWNNLNKLPTAPIIKLAIRFLLLTVSRTIDVRKVKWSDIDLKGRVWTLPTSKNGRMHRVYLGDLALTVLEEAKTYTFGEELVFGSSRKKVENNGIKTSKILERNSLSQPIVNNFKLLEITEKFTPHDLRRTGATIIAGLFGRRDFASLALNHTNNDATTIYDQYVYDREKKITLNALNKAIELIVNSPNVESVPSFEELRMKVIQLVQPLSFHQGKRDDSQQGLQASFSNPVSYKLSYVHNELRGEV